MMGDWCTWDDDYNQGIVQNIRARLVRLAASRPDDYTAVLLQGSGTYCVEATLGTAVRPTDHLLIAANGAYGQRMGTIARYYGLPHHVLSFGETSPVSPEAVGRYLDEHPETTHVALVHCETTTGILNPLEAVARTVKERGLTLAGARQKLKDNKETTIRQEDIVNRLKQIREELRAMRDAFDAFVAKV